MNEELSILRSENEALRHQISTLCALVEQLQAENLLLKGGKNSRTSSTAPSQDIGRSNQKSLRPVSGKKSGGQLGHTGSTLRFSDTPDQVIDHHPTSCAQCGESLQGAESSSFIRRQIVDIPPVLPLYTEHRSHVKTCSLCQFETKGVFPERVNAPIQYGAGIEAITGYLSVYQCLPYKRICQFFQDVFGLNLSQGSVDTFLNNLSQKSNSVYQIIRDRITDSEVVGGDETGSRVGGKKHWFHVWQTPLLTFIVSCASRGYGVFEQYFKDGFINSFYVSDCWASQLKAKVKARQLCMAHLLRELTNFVDNLKSDWSAQTKALFGKAIDLKKQMTENDFRNPPPEIASLNEELDQLLKVDFSGFHPKEQAFIKRLNKHRQNLFTFLTYQNVPTTNNASEQAIRNIKIKTKVSGQFRNKEGKGADRYAKIRSVIDTTIKNGQDVYGALMALANCRIAGVPE